MSSTLQKVGKVAMWAFVTLVVLGGISAMTQPSAPNVVQNSAPVPPVASSDNPPIPPTPQQDIVEPPQKVEPESTKDFNYNIFIENALSNLRTNQINFERINNRLNCGDTDCPFQLNFNKLIFTSPITNDRQVFDVQAIGTLAPSAYGYETWEWAWANESVPTELTTDSLLVKNFGQKNDEEMRKSDIYQLIGNPLTTAVFKSDEVDAENMAAATLFLAGGVGIYKMPFTNANGKATMYLLVKSITNN